MQNAFIELKRRCAIKRAVVVAWCAFCLTPLVLPTLATASFTASFQPCELPAGAAGNSSVLARCQVEFAGKTGSVELLGDAPDQLREVVFRDHDGRTVQRIAVSARPFIDPENVSIIVRDMNFDGMPDFGLRDFAVNGANEPWKFWLWDALRRQFVYHEGLSRLPNPEVSRMSKVLRSYVIDAENNVTTNIYFWRNGKLFLRGSQLEPARK